MLASLLFVVALADTEAPISECTSSLSVATQTCYHSTPTTWNSAKRLIFELNRATTAEIKWHLPSIEQLAELPLPCETNAQDAQQWWMSSGFLQHGDEILVGAYHCESGATEFVPVNQALKLLLIR
ncbi:hypothetical protein [Pseudidiomarina sp.]|uniref:hypothetical protein n=1 Tax=Pseudidiomarina sp. TaxID=2081707 RepID=UPI003A97A617